MDKRELAYAKQSALTTSNWNIFQIVIRKVLKPIPDGVAKGRSPVL
jgi:hypothetical protein